MVTYNKISGIDLNQIILWCLAYFLFGLNLAQATDQNKSICVSASPSGVTLLDNKTESLTLKFDVGMVDFHPVTTAEGEFVLPTISGFSRSFKTGEPSLPMVNKLISIPFDCQLQVDIVSSEFEIYNLEEIGITTPIMPVQPSLSKSDEPSEVPFVYNRSLYQIDKFYQLPLIDTEILGTLRSQHLALVSFSPFEYNPVQNSLRVCRSLTVNISYLNPDWIETDSMHKNHYSPFFEPVYRGIINYNSSSAPVRSDIASYPIKYLIVSDRMFENQLQPFIEWKTKKGFDVVVAYTDVIGATSSAIKSYINNLYNSGTPENPAPSFVLLVGDDQQIPAFDANKGSFVTDLHFCEFTGDYLPDMYYGRFSAQNTFQLQPQIDKTLEYEQYLMPDPSYLGEVTLVSGNDDQNASSYGNGQINYGTENYFNVTHDIDPNVWLYPSSSMPGADEDIIETINNGVGFYNYTAHCTHYGHQDPEFFTNDVDDLTNIHKYFLGIGNCCQTNTFSSDFGSPCFGEAFLQAEDRGGIGYIGASEDTYWDEDYWWAVGYGPVDGGGPDFEDTGPGAFDGVFHDHGEPVSQHFNTNGAIVMAGNLAVTESGSSRSDYYWEVYHLMGDPSVMTYFGMPTANSVTHPPAADMHGYSIVVTATAGSYVGITANGILHGAGYVDLSGTVTIPLTPFPETGTADIVVCAQNKIPYFGSLDIVENSDPHVIFESNAINDASLGNGNSIVDVGEPILLGVELKNVGIADALDVEAVLSTEDPYITITDDTELYGTISGGYSVKYLGEAFSFYFDADAPDGHTAIMTLSVTGTGGGRSDPPWLSEFTVTVHSPSFSIKSISIDDSAENGNGLIEPGETAEIILAIENTGSGVGGNIIGTLAEPDSFVFLDNPASYYGDISAGTEVDNFFDPFIISIEPACFPGYEKTFSLDISGNFGYAAALNFDMIIGGRAEIYTDDFSSDKGWSGLDGAAEWTIGPATGGNGSDTYGFSDPEFDNTGTEDNCVLGNDLNSGTSGDYNPNLSSTDWVVSPVIDCSYYDGIQLYFYRYLGIEGNGHDFALLEVYDGSEWVRLFESSTTLNESSWSEQYYDLSAYADRNPDFQIRFGLGATNSYANYCGWNIDDIRLLGYDQSGTCGDINSDGNIDILDIVFLINFKYKGGPAPDPLNNANVDGIDPINILDIVYLINNLYKLGPAPDCP